MYEPIRTKSIHSTSGEQSRFPRHSREEELDIQLAGHLAALLALTDALRALSPAEEVAELGEAGGELSAHLRRLRGGSPVRAVAGAVHGTDLAALHRRAHALAGRALVVAASRADTGAAILAARRMEAHAAAAGSTGSVAPTALAA
ncbi:MULTISPECIES: hypothetical protein [Streptomyces]|uniref:HPt domain-containing protein n=1 Tax=Streptomyces evansiae TaxID=3075535 RepID=A0ABU2R7M3_9ACTN|nr:MULTISPECIES: hypothetical protein [unclassified Streptomyces]MDT0412261.1 hypothetical protein [Streptomyces sp. DSM 41979]MYQ60484.1 hypothetical protein [Streptomyces sp. SID4926]SCD39622.1 hypothetical protein GA0115252_10461 [Streptomyces sp. DfronAA-171]